MVSKKTLKTVILAGPTAVGKSALAMEIAIRFQTQKTVEIINADSVCFYRHFNIGSAKPSPMEQQQVPHHLLDIADPQETYHAGDFYRDCLKKIQEIRARGHLPLIVGGSGFYLKTLRLGLWDAPPTSPEFRAALANRSSEELHLELQSLDPKRAAQIGAQDRYRLIRALEIIHLSKKIPSALQAQMPLEPDSQFELWALQRDPGELEQRMRQRIEAMMAQGWLQEVIQLRDRYPLSKALHSVGYQQILDFLNGTPPSGRKIQPGIPGLIDEITLAHRQLAKQQRTWLKNLKPDRTWVLEAQREELFDCWGAES